MQVDKYVNAILEFGYVVIEDIIPAEDLDVIRRKMDIDLAYVIKNKFITGSYGSIKGHIQLNPPPFKQFVYPSIVAN